MVRIQWLALLGMIVYGGLGSTAHAEYIDTTGSLISGHVALTGAVALTTDDNAFLGLQVHESVGLAGGVDLTFRQILSVANPEQLLLGGALKWTILQQAKYPVGLALWAGGHYRLAGQAAAEFQLLVDKTWQRLTPFVGLLTQIPFPNLDLRLHILAGLKLAFNGHVAWLTEGGVDVLGRHAFVATGIQVRF